MDSTKYKYKLHSIKEWETAIKSLPVEVNLRECLLNKGMVTRYYGTAEISGRPRKLEWVGDGKCYYKGRRITKLDVHFNTTL